MSAAPPNKAWRVIDLLRWTTEHFAAKGLDTPRLDAEVLLAHALGCERLQLYLEFEKPVEAPERGRFRELVRRRADARVPVALLTGRREFWSLPLAVTGDVLVPRPETERLVEVVLAALPDREGAYALADLGTGSGAVALALASERPKARVVATDLSPAALAVARANAEATGLGAQLDFAEGDACEPLAGRRFDAIAANPPYLGEAEEAGLAPELAHEPRLALFSGRDGTDLLRRLVSEAPEHLVPGGLLALELAPPQAPLVTEWLAQAGLQGVAVHRDLAGCPRIVSARAPAQEE